MTWRNHRGEIVTVRGNWRAGKFSETRKGPGDRVISNERIAGAGFGRGEAEKQGRS